MNEKKGFFSFFKGTSKTSYRDEETKQREYALTKKMEEQGHDQGSDQAQDSFKELNEERDKLTLDDDENDGPSELTEAMIERTVALIQELLQLAEFTCEVKTQKLAGKKIFLEITNNEEQIGRIIGKDGSTLFAFQLILNAMLSKEFELPIKAILDAGDYRAKKVALIKSNALRAARKVMKLKQSVPLSPMNSAERRLVHMLFKNDPKIVSHSVGDGSDRHIVLDFKYKFRMNRNESK